MGLWPFGSSKKARLKSSDEHTQHSTSEKENTDPMSQPTELSNRENEKLRRHSSKRGPDEKTGRRLSKPRKTSQQSGAMTAPPRSQPTPSSTRNDGDTDRGRDSPVTSRAAPSSLYQQNLLSQSSIGPEAFHATANAPTLHAHRSDHQSTMPRRKSSKRKAEEFAREREIRAMTTSPIPVPKRPATYGGNGILRRETRSIPGGLNTRLQRPTSDVSLPVPEDISDMDDRINQSSFKIGILSALSPRPTLKYETNPRGGLNKEPARMTPVQMAIEEEDLSPQKRIDELADTMDSSGIRELMERDRRRKERKKEAEKAKLQRKLQKRAERQKEEEETRRKRAEEYVASSRSRMQIEEGESSRILDPERTDENSRMTDTEMVPMIEKSKSPAIDPFSDQEEPRSATSHAIRNPFEDEKDFDVMRDPSDHDEEPPLPVRSPLRKVPQTELVPEPQSSQIALSPPTSPIHHPMDRQSASQASLMAREITPDIPENEELDRRASDQSSQYLGSWRSFFRRGTSRRPSATDRGRTTPSEFSNTSRESFAKRQPPPVVAPRTFRRSDAKVPQRTLSKFREDLPELPLSPPDSRVQSPEVSSISHSAILGQTSHQARQSLTGTLDARSLATSSSNPTLDKMRPDSRLDPRGSMDVDMTGTGTGSGNMTLSQSLASVDSEGSWLSGKPMKRFSGALGQTLPEGRISPVVRSPGASRLGEAAMSSHEQLGRLSPPPEDKRESSPSRRDISGTSTDLQGDGNDTDLQSSPAPATKDGTWHGSVGRQATIVRQPSRARSKEGLLKEYEEGDNASFSGSEYSDDHEENVEFHDAGEGTEVDAQQPTIFRARSVDYKGHVRHISAGSARLLDIQRASVHSTETPPRSPALQKPDPLAEQPEKDISKV